MAEFVVRCHIGLLELRLWNEANIASLWSKMVVRPMRFLGRTSRLRFSGSFSTQMHLWVAEKYSLFWMSVWLWNKYWTVFYGDVVALGICQERWKTNPKEHWMLYYKLHAGCQKPFVLGGFFLAPKRQQKALRYLKAGLKTTSGIAFLLMIFILFKKWLKHKCFMKKHTYILWWW